MIFRSLISHKGETRYIPPRVLSRTAKKSYSSPSPERKREEKKYIYVYVYNFRQTWWRRIKEGDNNKVETYLNIKVSSGVLRLRGSLLLLLLLGRRRALWGWRSLCTKELRRVRVWMLEMMRRWCLMMLKMMRRSWGKGGHEMFLASDHIDTRLQQYHPATTGAHSQCSSRVLLKFLLAWRRLATPRCTTVSQE